MLTLKNIRKDYVSGSLKVEALRGIDISFRKNEFVAVLAGESYRTISTAINACKDTNFKGWVNGYRVQEASRLISGGYLTDHTTDALAAAVGFSNRTNFYRVFKKTTGKSPTDF